MNAENPEYVGLDAELSKKKKSEVIAFAVELAEKSAALESRTTGLLATIEQERRQAKAAEADVGHKVDRHKRELVEIAGVLQRLSDRTRTLDLFVKSESVPTVGFLREFMQETVDLIESARRIGDDFPGGAMLGSPARSIWEARG